MGGFGTYRLLARWPDLFARGFWSWGRPGVGRRPAASLRNTPLLAWNATADELVNIKTSRRPSRDLDRGRAALRRVPVPEADHLTLATND